MKTIHFIGQAPPKPPGPAFPFGNSKLYKWFEQIGMNDFEIYDDRDGWNKILKVKDRDLFFAFDAIYTKFPGSNKNGHLVPTREQILADKDYLSKSLNQINADLIVPIGKLSISYCLDPKSYISMQSKVDEIKLEDIIGQEFEVNPYGLMIVKKNIIPLPHPSGASSWVYREENAALLETALILLNQNFK
jgi:uracil-DNA glycosylase